MSLNEFCAEADRIGLTAEVLAAQLAQRPEFADCVSKAPVAGEAVAWQSRFVGSPHNQWATCSKEHYNMVLSSPLEWPDHDVRALYTAPQAPQQAECPECIEQARLLGMGSEREAALMAEVDRLKRICTSLHDGLLRGEDDRDLIALAASGWDGKQAPQQADLTNEKIAAAVRPLYQSDDAAHQEPLDQLAERLRDAFEGGASNSDIVQTLAEWRTALEMADVPRRQNWVGVMSNLLWAAEERDRKNRIREFDAFVAAARAEIAAGMQAPGMTDAKDAARYRWLRDRNDWYAEPRLDEKDGTKWELVFYSPQRITDPSDDDNLDAAVDAAIAGDSDTQVTGSGQ